MSDKSESIFRLANAYARDLANSERSAVSGEPEAQLTVPVSNLLSGLVSVSDLGRLDLIRETRLDRTRPDFAAMHTAGGRTHQKGYVELKAPGVTVDVSKWKGRNATQWERMKDEAEIVIVCNGAEAQLYHHGVAKGPAVNLPIENPEQWDSTPLVGMLGRFLELRPLPVTKVTDLSQRLAVRTADLRDRILWLLDQEGDAASAANGGLGAWRRHVYPEASAQDALRGVTPASVRGVSGVGTSEGKQS